MARSQKVLGRSIHSITTDTSAIAPKPVDICLTVLNKLVTWGMSQPLISDNVLHFTMDILRALFLLLLSQVELGTNPLNFVISETGNYSQ